MTDSPLSLQSLPVLVERNIRYREAAAGDPNSFTLDIYHERLKPGERKRSIVVFIHGGGWNGGDKACFLPSNGQSMPEHFVRNGYVFASVNYRLAERAESPPVGIPDMASDIAKALKWLSINGRRYGGRKAEFILIGYSSGAYLAMLVATHQKYLSCFRLAPDLLSAVIVLDMPLFDIPMTVRILENKESGLPDQERRLQSLYQFFGKTPAEQEALSPAHQLGPWLTQTAFLIVSVGQHFGHHQWLTRRMGENFQRRLASIRARVKHLHFEDRDHKNLILQFDDELASSIDSFLRSLPSLPSRATRA
jgi:acetyl esterase/lipase